MLPPVPTAASYDSVPSSWTAVPIGCCARGRTSPCRPRSSTCCCFSWRGLGAGLEGRPVQGAVAGRRGHRQRTDPGRVRAPPGAWRRRREADLRADRRAARLPVHRRRRAAGFGRRGRARRARAAGAAVADDCGAGLRQRQRRSGAGLAVVGHRRDRDQRSARRTLAIIDRVRVVEAVGAAARAVDAARELLASIAPSSAASSAPAIGCASPRASSTPDSGETRPRPRRTARSTMSSSCRTGLCRSSPTRSAAGRPAPAGGAADRDTSSLEAYHAFTEGRVKLESLDSARGAGGDRRFRAGDDARSPIRGGARRPRQRPVLAVPDVARPQSARRRPAGAGDRSRPSRHRARTRSG